MDKNKHIKRIIERISAIIEKKYNMGLLDICSICKENSLYVAKSYAICTNPKCNAQFELTFSVISESYDEIKAKLKLI